MSIKGQCSSCGLTMRRRLKDMARPCPECGGRVHIDEEDLEVGVIVGVVAILLMMFVTISFVYLGVGER